jgi:hypothetical protein
MEVMLNSESAPFFFLTSTVFFLVFFVFFPWFHSGCERSLQHDDRICRQWILEKFGIGLYRSTPVKWYGGVNKWIIIRGGQFLAHL